MKVPPYGKSIVLFRDSFSNVTIIQIRRDNMRHSNDRLHFIVLVCNKNTN